MKTFFRAGFLCLLLSVAARAESDEDTEKRLSTLWTVISLNMIASDVLTSFMPGKREELERLGGPENVKYTMLAGALMYEIPISMIFLSHYLPREANRWTNVTAAALTALLVIAGGSTDPHYIFMASAQTIAAIAVTWTALDWPENRHEAGAQSQLGLMGLQYSYRF